MHQTPRRQIVFVMTDSQGVNLLGCYGRPALRTPRIDALAAEGVRFDRAYTASPVCGPARSALFTGLYPHANGAWSNDQPLGLNVRTLAQRLRDAGAPAAYIGKWHLDATDYFGSGVCPDGWDPAWWYDMRNYLEELTPEERVRSRQTDTPAKVHAQGIEAGFTYGRRVSDRARAFLEQNAGRDFFLTVSYDEPHHPWLCPPPWCDLFSDFEYPLGPNGADPLDGKPAHQREWAAQAGLPRGRQVRHPMYFGCNSFIDDEIGRVIDAVNRHAPGALVVFTSDHGEPLGTHGLPSKGPAMYDETTRIPLIMRWPSRIPAGTVDPAPVSHIDLMPTFLEIMGAPLAPCLQGRSLAPYLEAPTARPAAPAFIEFNRYEVNHEGWGGLQPIRCACDGRYKLVLNLLDRDECYDLEADPDEMHNRIDDPALAPERDRLHRAILDWMGRTLDPFRGYAWERRPWCATRALDWSFGYRHRPDDGYEKRVLDYATGLDVPDNDMNRCCR